MAGQFCVIAEVPQKPTEFPECFFGGVQTAIEGFLFCSDWFQNNKSQFEVRLLRLPTKEGAINANREEALEKVLVIGLSGMQAGDMAPHDVTSFR
jgi:hypothetical protein